MKKQWFLSFQFDNFGRGALKLREDSLVALSIPARTGSLRDMQGKTVLINSMPAGIWRILDKPVDTTETACVRTENEGWKVRLYTHQGQWTRFLIHPDGAKGGTEGCVGLQEDGLDLRARLTQILKIQTEIFLFANVPSPDSEKADEQKKTA